MQLVLNPSALEGMFRAPDGPVSKALAQKAFAVENAAKRLCPVDTGRLRASITTVLGQDDKGEVALVGSAVTYALWQEIGTRFQQGTPFLRPALYGAGAWPAVPDLNL